MSQMDSPQRKAWQKSQNERARSSALFLAARTKAPDFSLKPGSTCVTLRDGTPYKFSQQDIDAALREWGEVPDLREQMMEQIAAKLAEGIPVTLSCGDKRICTYYPDGTSERHDWR